VKRRFVSRDFLLLVLHSSGTLHLYNEFYVSLLSALFVGDLFPARRISGFGGMGGTIFLTASYSRQVQYRARHAVL
jgi:hypothetical protein